MQDFLWSKHDRDRGFHWVSWDEICCPKEDGSLGIRLLRTMNEMLKTKWLWRFVIEDDALWKKVIVSKYFVRFESTKYKRGVNCVFSIFAKFSQIARGPVWTGCS